MRFPLVGSAAVLGAAAWLLASPAGAVPLPQGAAPAAPATVSAATPPAPAPGAEPGRAQQVLAEVAAKSKDPKMAKVVAAAVESAGRALERARGARAAGDGPHARLLDGLALEWAETARDLLRAASVESDATRTGKKAAESATQVERGRALLSETQARRGRAAAELERVEAEAKDAAKGAATAEESRIAKKKDVAAEPKKGEPKKGEPKKAEPKKSEPRKAEPPPGPAPKKGAR